MSRNCRQKDNPGTFQTDLRSLASGSQGHCPQPRSAPSTAPGSKDQGSSGPRPGEGRLVSGCPGHTAKETPRPTLELAVQPPAGWNLGPAHRPQHLEGTVALASVSGRQRSAQPPALLSRQQPARNIQMPEMPWGWRKPLCPGLAGFVLTVAGVSGHQDNSWLRPEMTRGRTLGFGSASGQKPQRMALPAQPWPSQPLK